jgi:7-keto-8-aminopelargonate synthetase-like enzyme
MSRLPPPLRVVDRTFVEYRGRRLSYFGGCDYYRLATHPAVIAAARDALDAEGMGVAASRLTTGNHPLFGALEAWLAQFFRVPRAILADAGRRQCHRGSTPAR